MPETIISVVLLSLVVAFNANAKDSDRIDQVEKEVQALNLRISKLEPVQSTPSSDKEVVSSSEGWKSIASRRQLARSMSASDVKRILGEPHRVNGGGIASWYYQNGGKVVFISGEVSSWSEPRK
jgi:hypothetical protein